MGRTHTLHSGTIIKHGKKKKEKRKKGARVTQVKNTHYIRRFGVLDLEEVHRSDHGLHGHENVLVHEFDEPLLVIIRVARPVDDSHLFDEGGFAGFTSTCNKIVR